MANGSPNFDHKLGGHGHFDLSVTNEASNLMMFDVIKAWHKSSREWRNFFSPIHCAGSQCKMTGLSQSFSWFNV